MDISSFGPWLDQAFAGFDYAVLEAVHGLAESIGFILTPLLWLISFTGENGALVLITGVILLFFKKTRKVGICMLIAVVIGALFTNVLLKELIARDRPFVTSPVYFDWWQEMGSMGVTDMSFPSGHVTAATAGAVAIILTSRKNLTWLALLYVALMMLSRMYFVVHYPTDVIAGFIVGGIAAVFASWIVRLIYRQINRRRRGRTSSEAQKY